MRDAANSPPRWTVWLILCAGVASFSTAAIFIKLADDAPAPVIAAARMSIAAILLLPIALLKHGPTLARVPPGCRVAVIFAGFFLGAHFFFWVMSLKYTSVLSSVVIVTTNPIFVAIASPLLLREKIGRRTIQGIIFAAAGGALIAFADAGGASGSLYGNFLSLMGVLMASSYWLVGRSVRGRVDLLSYIVPVYGVAAIVLVCAALAMRCPFTGYRPATYQYFLLLALLPQLLGHTAMNYALRHVSATVVAIAILGEPIGASAIAMVQLHEIPTPIQLCGAALILAGIARAVMETPPKEQPLSA